MNNYMKLEIPAKSTNEAFVRATVGAFAGQIDPTIEELSDIKTAVSEGVTNAIIHGYESMGGVINIICRIEDNIIEIIIKDFGVGITDIEKAREPLYTSKPDEERSGMGFTVMETFMDTLIIESSFGEGTKLTMRKQIKRNE